MVHKISIDGDALVVEFLGWEKIAALKMKELWFSLQNVVSITTESRKWLEGIRYGGTGVPGVIKEGRYLLHGKKAFFATRDINKCLTIEFKNEPYTYLIVEVRDKERSAKEINKKMDALKRCMATSNHKNLLCDC